MPQLSIAFLTFEHAVYLKRPFVPIVEENPQGDFLFECIHNTSLQFFGITNIAMRSISVYLANVGIVLQHILYILYRYRSISNAERENWWKVSGIKMPVPFYCEDELKKSGAIFMNGGIQQEHVVVDGRLVTGQNPASARKVAETVVDLLCH